MSAWSSSLPLPFRFGSVLFYSVYYPTTTLSVFVANAQPNHWFILWMCIRSYTVSYAQHIYVSRPEESMCGNATPSIHLHRSSVDTPLPPTVIITKSNAITIGTRFSMLPFWLNKKPKIFFEFHLLIYFKRRDIAWIEIMTKAGSQTKEENKQKKKSLCKEFTLNVNFFFRTYFQNWPTARIWYFA